MLSKKRLLVKRVASEGVTIVKDVELKLISELMKDSRRSDRELAKAIGVSQPTISRMIRKLEKGGIVKEYTMIPNFSKLGFGILAITFVKRPKDVSAAELDKIMVMGQEIAEKRGMKSILALRGIGLGYDVAVISVHEDYASYLEVVNGIREFPGSDAESIQSFLINLRDAVQYRALTLSYLAGYLKEKAAGAKP
jgi:DNA-binding Lrp family transcriptional regulator